MEMSLAPSTDPGLQSVLENGLTIIRTGGGEEHFRSLILDELIQIFSQADQGSQALKTRNLLAAMDNQIALERLSLFLNYLTFGTEELPERLSEAASVLAELREGRPQTEAKRNRVCEVIEKLLEGLKNDFATIPLAASRALNFQH